MHKVINRQQNVMRNIIKIYIFIDLFIIIYWESYKKTHLIEISLVSIISNY